MRDDRAPATCRLARRSRCPLTPPHSRRVRCLPRSPRSRECGRGQRRPQWRAGVNAMKGANVVFRELSPPVPEGTVSRRRGLSAWHRRAIRGRCPPKRSRDSNSVIYVICFGRDDLKNGLARDSADGIHQKTGLSSPDPSRRPSASSPPAAGQDGRAAELSARSFEPAFSRSELRWASALRRGSSSSSRMARRSVTRTAAVFGLSVNPSNRVRFVMAISSSARRSGFPCSAIWST